MSTTTSTEVRNFKKEMKPLLEYPLGLADQINQFWGSNIYSWAELMSTLNILLTREQKGMIRRAAISIWEREHAPSQGVQPAEQKVPNLDTGWDKNDPGHRVRMQELRKLIIKGIRGSAPRSQNIIKLLR